MQNALRFNALQRVLTRKSATRFAPTLIHTKICFEIIGHLVTMIHPLDEELLFIGRAWRCFSAKQLRLGTIASKVNAYNGCVALLGPGDTLVIPSDWCGEPY